VWLFIWNLLLEQRHEMGLDVGFGWCEWDWGFGLAECKKLQTLLAENQHENKVLYLLFKMVVCNSASVDCTGKLNRFHKPASRQNSRLSGDGIKVVIMKCSL